MKTKIQGLERLSEFWKISSKVVRGLGPDPKTLNKPRPPPPSGCFLEDLVFLLRAALWNLGLAHHLGPRALLQVCSKAEPFTVTKFLAKHFKRKKGLFGLVVLEGFPTSWCGRCDGKTAAPILVGLPVTWHSREGGGECCGHLLFVYPFSLAELCAEATSLDTGLTLGLWS